MKRKGIILPLALSGGILSGTGAYSTAPFGVCVNMFWVQC